MATLIYGPAARELNIDDRILAHLEVVIVGKLRRAESFAFTWVKPPEEGDGQHLIWIHPAIFLEFVFDGADRIELNRDWVEALMARANSPRGLELVPEPLPAS